MYFEKLHLKIWQWFPQTCEASFFLLPLYSKDVFHYDCYLWTQNLDIYLLQLNSSPPSSHLISSFMSPASLLSHFTDMCLCSHSILFLGAWQRKWWLFLVFVSFFFLHCLCSSVPWKPKKSFYPFYPFMLSTQCESVLESLSIWGNWDTIGCSYLFGFFCFCLWTVFIFLFFKVKFAVNTIHIL